MAPRLLEFSRRRLVIAILRDNLCADPGSRHPEHRECAVNQSLPDDDCLPRPHSTGRFCKLAVDGNTARAAGVRGQAARPEDADGPEPSVHAFCLSSRNHRGGT